MIMLLKRGLGFAVLIFVLGLVGCMTAAPFITSFTGLPATMPPSGTATLTAVGGPGSSAGPWSWSFTVSPAGCGTVAPASYPPGQLTTVTTTFTAGTPGPCTVTVTLTTASGRKATSTQMTTIIAPVPSLPSCTHPELSAPGVSSGGVDNHPITGAAGDRAFVYVQLYDAAAPYNDDTILHLRSAALATPSNCPAAGDLECDDDDGGYYTSLGGTWIAEDYNSLIAGHPLGSSSDVVAVHGWGGAAVDPYRLYSHVVPAANLVVYTTDPGGTVATAADVPTTPTPWMIGQEITSGDADWYRFQVSEGAIFVALDSSPNAPGAPHDEVSGWWPELRLYSSTGALLKTVNNYYIGPQPWAEALAIRVPAGTYFIGVHPFSPTQVGSYHLTACYMASTTLPLGDPGRPDDEIKKERVEKKEMEIKGEKRKERN